jgi:regulator-associated protein of mTOR
LLYLFLSSLQNERVLFHYNGHGVPRPTVNGEIWVFNSRYTQYIPLSMYELQSWMGTPCIYVLDCSAAGLIINNFKAMIEQRQQQLALQQQQAAAAAGLLGGAAAAAAAAAAATAAPDPMREIIVLGACGGNELLPQVRMHIGLAMLLCIKVCCSDILW